jgi:hypothetical protein
MNVKGVSPMGGKRIWERIVKRDTWSDAKINVHITESDRRKIERIDRNVSYVNPNRIGIDFDNFHDNSHDYIPNVSIADLVQLINRLHLLQKDYVREAIKTKALSHGFGVELDSRRKVDFDLGICETSGEETIVIEYEDQLRKIDRFEIGSIDVEHLSDFIRAMKEAYIEYDHIVKRTLILGELI